MALSQERLDGLKEQADIIQGRMIALQIAITANGGEPIPWPPDEQAELLTAATLFVWWLGVDLACYPIGPNSVILYGPSP